MSQGIPGIARNSCPLCGELTRVPMAELFRPGQTRRTRFFRCSACNGRICVAPSTAITATFGGLLGLVPGLYALCRLPVWLDRIGWHPRPNTLGEFSLRFLLPMGTIFAGYVLAATCLGRFTLQLEPA
jgi:hypothetical protein